MSVKFMHIRCAVNKEKEMKGSNIKTKGGITLAYDKDKSLLAFSICVPEDGFNRKRGRDISKGVLTCERIPAVNREEAVAGNGRFKINYKDDPYLIVDHISDIIERKKFNMNEDYVNHKLDSLLNDIEKSN